MAGEWSDGLPEEAAGSGDAWSDGLPYASTAAAGPALSAGSITFVSRDNFAGEVSLELLSTADGTPPYTYQWHRSTSAGFTPSGATELAGETSTTLTTTFPTDLEVYYFKVVVTDAAAATAETAEFAVNSGHQVARAFEMTTFPYTHPSTIDLLDYVTHVSPPVGSQYDEQDGDSVWWKFTLPDNAIMVSIYHYRPTGSALPYAPTFIVYEGTPLADASNVVWTTTGSNQPVWVWGAMSTPGADGPTRPLVEGQEYYIRVYNKQINETGDSTLLLKFDVAYHIQVIPDGALVINDDTPPSLSIGFGFVRPPAAVIDYDSGDILGWLPDMPNGEYGGQNRNGVIALDHKVQIPYSHPIELYNADLTFRARVLTPTGYTSEDNGGFIVSLPNDANFYVAHNNDALTASLLRLIDQDGNELQRWDIPYAVASIGVNWTRSIFYFVHFDFSFVDSKVYRWDLENEVLIDGPHAAVWLDPRGIVVLPDDGYVLCDYGGSFVARYDATGTEVDRYTPLASSNGLPALSGGYVWQTDRVAYQPRSQDTFLLWLHAQDVFVGDTIFQVIQL